MSRNEGPSGDQVIEDAVFEEIAAERPGLNPQLALWLSRGFLCAIVCATALILRPYATGPSSPGPRSEVVSAPAIATPGPAVVPAVMGSRPEDAVETVVLPPSGFVRRPVATATEPPLPSPAPADEMETGRDAVDARPGRPEKSEREQRPRRHARQPASETKPLAAIARGAKRTFRSVGRSLSRLF